MAAADLSCTKCSSPFSAEGTEPKTLRCLHTFCVKCLNIEYEDEDKPFVLCPAPLCGTRHYLESGQTLKSGLKTDYLLERASLRFQVLSRADARCDLCDQPDNAAKSYCETCRQLLCGPCSRYHKIMIATKTHELQEISQQLPLDAHYPIAPYTTKKKWKCEGHRESEKGVEEVSMYCVTCSSMICSTCAMGRHSKHILRTAYEVLNGTDHPDYCVERHLDELKGIRDEYAAALDSTNRQLDELDRAWRLVGENIKRTTDNLQMQLVGERDMLMKKVEDIHDTRVEEITKELKALSESKVVINHSIEFVKKALMCTPEDILDQEKFMVNWLQQLRCEYNQHPREPSQRDVFNFTTDPVDLNGVIGQVYTNPDLPSLVKGVDKVSFVQGKRTEFLLTCLDQIRTSLPSTDFEVIPVEVRPDADLFTVRNNQNGTYTVTLQPRCSGELSIQLQVQYEAKTVPLDPVTVVVSPALLEEAQVTKRMQCEHFREMISPTGIAVRGQNIAVVDQKAHKLFIITLDGHCLNVIGDEGEYECEFNAPQGVVWWDENLVVADTENNRIQALSIGGDFFNEFGNIGGHPGEFMNPTDVAIAVSQGNTTLYVADSVNHRIQFFKMTDVLTDGELMGIYADQSKPLLLCVDHQNQVFVVDGISGHFEILSHKESEPAVDVSHDHKDRSTPEPRQKYLPELELVCSCTYKETPEDMLVEVQCIAYDSQTRYLLMTELGSPFISVFSRNGTYVGSVRCPGVGVQLASIAVYNSCTLAYDSASSAIFMLKLF